MKFKVTINNEYKSNFDTKEEALHYAMMNLFLNIGNGDGENGGAGSLWRCAKEIYDDIANGKTYSYADFSVSVNAYQPTI